MSNSAELEICNVLLFDVDGVLVDPIAYKKGIAISIETLCNEIGLSNSPELRPDDSDVSFMESKGIHDVWDMTDIVFSQILSSIYQQASCNPNSTVCSSIDQKATDQCSQSSNSFDQQFSNFSRLIKEKQIRIPRPDYKDFATRITTASSFQNLKCPSHPPDGALALLLADSSSSIRENDSGGDDLPNLDFMLEAFLKSTRSAYESYGTRIFQNIILGTDDFESTYNLPSRYLGPSLLKSEDRVLLNSKSLQELQTLRKEKHAKLAVYTARPSLAPPDKTPLSGYSPEAEIAVQAAGLADLPLVGMGMMEWLAAQHEERTEDLTKPNTTHSLSALIAALKESNNSEILELAYKIDKDKDSNSKIDKGSSIRELLEMLKNKHLNIFVFEDTSSGIKPMLALEKRLIENQVSAKVTALGIARDSNKKETLASLCKAVFPDVNAALEHVLSLI